MTGDAHYLINHVLIQGYKSKNISTENGKLYLSPFIYNTCLKKMKFPNYPTYKPYLKKMPHGLVICPEIICLIFLT